MALRYFFTLISVILLFTASTAQKKEQLPRFQKHYVRDRETASSIASNFNVKLKDFLMLNNFPNDVKLHPGQEVLVRQLKDGEKVAEEKAPKKHEETASKSDEEDDTRSTSEAEPVETQKDATTSSKTETHKPETTIEMLTGPNGTKYELSSGGFHVVQKGQTFYRIALIYHLTMDQLKALNNMTTTNIKVGQELRISK